MAATFLFHVFLPLIPNLPMVGDEPDEATRERMAQYALFMEKEMVRIWREVEEKWTQEKTQEQWAFAWGALLSTAFQQWHLWVIAGGLVLLLSLCFCLRKRSREADSNSAEESSGGNMLKVEEEDESEGKGYDKERDLDWNLEPYKKEKEEEKEVEEEVDESEGKGYDKERDLDWNLEPYKKEKEEEKEVEEEVDESEGKGYDKERDLDWNLEPYKKEEEEEKEVKEEEEESEEEGPDDERDRVRNLEQEEEVEEEEEESEEEGPDDERDRVRNLEQVEEEEEVEVEEKEQEVEEEEKESEGEGSGEDKDWAVIDEGCVCKPVQYVTYCSLVVKELVNELLWVFQNKLYKSFYPVLQEAIGVGSSYEGWFPCGDDGVHQLLLPLKAPPGHTFNLELGTTGEMSAGDPCVRVQLECTCTGQQKKENMLCFLHHSHTDITKYQEPSLLHTLCTGCHLDVHKTACWFQNLVLSTWGSMPHSRRYNMKILPSNRSCRLELTSASGRTLFIELIFGVQHGDSDIFLSSQAPDDTSTPSSTMWPVTYAVAEVKFFKYMAKQVPIGRVHLNCLHLCAHILVNTSFSIYTFKTAVMHLLTTIPLSYWDSQYLVRRLRDIMQYVFCCLKEKRLKHFFLGNKNVPREINLPPSFRRAKPLNLFQHFRQHPEAHAKALHDFKQLKYRLVRMLVLHFKAPAHTG